MSDDSKPPPLPPGTVLHVQVVGPTAAPISRRRVVKEKPVFVAPAEPAIDNGRPRHGQDFCTITWNGRTWAFNTPAQRIIAAELWKAWEEGTDYVLGAYLLEEAGGKRSMADVFRGCEAWKELIVPGILSGGPSGSYRLALLAV
jgi:hypothetical protein